MGLKQIFHESANHTTKYAPRIMSFQSRNANSNPLFLHFFLSDSRNCEPSRSSKGMLNVKTVKTKKYRKETMINIAVL